MGGLYKRRTYKAPGRRTDDTISGLPSELLGVITEHLKQPSPEAEPAAPLSLADRFRQRVQQRQDLRRARLVSSIFSRAVTDSIATLEAPDCQLPAAVWGKFTNATDVIVTSSRQGSYSPQALLDLLATLPAKTKALAFDYTSPDYAKHTPATSILPATGLGDFSELRVNQTAWLLRTQSLAFASSISSLSLLGVEGLTTDMHDAMLHSMPNLKDLALPIWRSSSKLRSLASLPSGLTSLHLRFSMYKGMQGLMGRVSAASIAACTQLRSLKLECPHEGRVQLFDSEQLSSLAQLTYLDAYSVKPQMEPQQAWQLLASLPQLTSARLGCKVAFSAGARPLGSHLTCLQLASLLLEQQQQQQPAEGLPAGSLAAATTSLKHLWVNSSRSLVQLLSSLRGHTRLERLTVGLWGAPEQWQQGLLASLPALTYLSLAVGGSDAGDAAGDAAADVVQARRAMVDAALADAAACAGLGTLVAAVKERPSVAVLRTVAARVQHLSVTATGGGCTLAGLWEVLRAPQPAEAGEGVNAGVGAGAGAGAGAGRAGAGAAGAGARARAGAVALGAGRRFVLARRRVQAAGAAADPAAVQVPAPRSLQNLSVRYAGGPEGLLGDVPELLAALQQAGQGHEHMQRAKEAVQQFADSLPFVEQVQAGAEAAARGLAMPMWGVPPLGAGAEVMRLLSQENSPTYVGPVDSDAGRLVWLQGGQYVRGELEQWQQAKQQAVQVESSVLQGLMCRQKLAHLLRFAPRLVLQHGSVSVKVAPGSG